jgi:radical SAM-linked protein
MVGQQRTFLDAGAVYAQRVEEYGTEGSLTGLRIRLAIRYAVDGDLRFISHHDTLRLFERALARAELPVRYSQGFNPRPRMSIVLPRPVGVASRDELLVVELESEMTPEDALSRLSQHMPVGLMLLAADTLEATQRRTPERATYSLALAPEQREGVAKKASTLLSAESLPMERTTPKSASRRSVDIRPYLVEVSPTLEGVQWTQTISQGGTARVGEVLEVLGLPSREHLHRVRRERVEYAS